MKRLMVISLMLAVFALAGAGAEISVEKIDKAPVIISELDNPAIFELVVDNIGEAEEIQVYTLIGVNILPRYPFEIKEGINTFEIKAYVPKEMRKSKGYFKFGYQIKGDKFGIYKDNLLVKIVPLKDVFSFSAKHYSINQSFATILVKNKEETFLDNVTIGIKSALFSGERDVSLKPMETIEISFPVNKEDLRTFSAGPYQFRAAAKYGSAEVNSEGIIDYLENQNLKISSTSEGIIIRKSSFTKSNEGNVPALVVIEKKQDIVSRLFAVHSIEPMKVERSGFYVKYIWEKSLEPSESFTVTTTTNYTMPLLILGFIIAIAVFVSIMLKTTVSVKKRVSFVRTRGGEFALKVRVHVKAKKYAENIQVIDRLPGMTTLYEKFGIKPDVIDNAGRKLVWKVPRLNAGEERVFSYIMYSKIKIVGRFELPSALAIFERDGKMQEVSSNRAYFLADTSDSEE